MATLGEEYKNIEQKADSYKVANRLNKQQKQLRKNTNASVSNFSDNLDKKEAGFKKSLDKYKAERDVLKNKAKSYKTQGKNQINSLIDLAIGSVDSPSGSDATKEIRNLFVRAIKNTRARIKNLLNEEVVKSLGCTQEQQFTLQPIYIPVESIDIFGYTLQYSPEETPGIYLYENLPFNPNTNPNVKPYSFNRELYNRLQNSESYLKQYNKYFTGPSGQPLFNITYVTTDDKNNDGQFYKVELQNRFTGNKIVDFIGEYYSSIDVVSIKEIYTNVLNAMTNSISFSKKFVDNDQREQKKWEIVIQRILGMCWDNKQEIDVSGVGKLDPLDQIDSDLLDFDDIDNASIEDSVKNFVAGVTEFLDCGSIKFPISSDLLPKLLEPFNDENLVNSNPDFLADNMLNELASNPEWKAKLPEFPFLNIAINKEFLRVALQAVINTLLSPKHLFPLVVMNKSLNSEQQPAQTFEDFVRYYKKFLMNLISNISAIFVEELLKEIKKNYKRITQDLLESQVQEILSKRKKSVASIITAINIGLTLAATIRDYRRCQNVIDELNRLLNLSQRLIRLTRGTTNPIWNTLAVFKPGMSTTSLMTRYLQEVGVLGVDTGDMPDGSPNTGLLAQRQSYQATMDEIAENSKVSIGINSADVYALGSGGAPIINLYGNLE